MIGFLELIDYSYDRVVLSNGQVMYSVRKLNCPRAEVKNNICTLRTNENDAGIIYTTDGTNPTYSNGKLYCKPFEIKRTTIIKAIAIKQGSLDSDIRTFYFDKEK